MFEKTRAVGNKIINDMRKTSFVISIISQILFIAFYIYSIIFQNGIWQVKTALLILATAYFIFYIAISQKGKSGKKTKKLVKMIYRYMKYVMNIVTIGMSIFSLCSDWSNSLLWDAVFVAINCLTLLIQIIVEVVRKVGESYIILLQEAIQEDAKPFIKIYETVTNPVAAAVDLINKPMSALARKLAPDKAKPKEIPEENLKLIRIIEEYKEDENEKEIKARLNKKAEVKEAKDSLKESAILIKEALKNKLKFSKVKDVNKKSVEDVNEISIEDKKKNSTDNKNKKSETFEVYNEHAYSKINKKIYDEKSENKSENKKIFNKNRENTETVKNVVTKTNEISNAEQPKINQNQRKFRKNKADFEETFEENITAKSNESLQENEYINIEIGKSNSTETAVQTESKGSLLKRFFIKKANK